MDSTGSIFIRNQKIDFWVTGNGDDFEVESDKVAAYSIETIADYFARHQADDYGDSIQKHKCPYTNAEITGDVVIAVTEDHNPWLDFNWIFIKLSEDYKQGIPISFTLKSAIAMRERQVIEILEKAIYNLPLELVEVRGVGDGGFISETNENASSWELNILLKDQKMKVSQLVQARFEMSISLFFSWGRSLNARGILEMVKRGGADQLVGHPESEIFEAKSSAFELQNKPEKLWKFQLAQSVAKFANSEKGGLVVIGLHTKRRKEIDTVDKVVPIPVSNSRADTYQKSLDSRIHPPIDGLEIVEAEHGKGAIVCIYIPPQKEENKPFIIQGGFIEGEYDASLISIVRRRGEGSIPLTAREIHSTLAAGRAFLRGRPDNTIR
ncbi:AlbA family DNA-binding domain-containing protein [Actinomadura luteofluorescens]|uniref:AlbA family DNA-binding domain-containing protein n=1 Tax=Actinomadura luteofluorescens TaxID=46163 RepID=UPI003D8D1FDA